MFRATLVAERFVKEWTWQPFKKLGRKTSSRCRAGSAGEGSSLVLERSSARDPTWWRAGEPSFPGPAWSFRRLRRQGKEFDRTGSQEDLTQAKKGTVLITAVASPWVERPPFFLSETPPPIRSTFPGTQEPPVGEGGGKAPPQGGLPLFCPTPQPRVRSPSGRPEK